MFYVKINLSPLRKKSRTGPNLLKEELLTSLPNSISRRQYYSQVRALLDLTNFLSPVLLQGKVILRKTLEPDSKDLDWDELLPRDITEGIIQFFISLFELEDVKFPWSL